MSNPGDIDARQELEDLLDAAGHPHRRDRAFLSVGGMQLTPRQVIGGLQPHMTERRLARIEKVVAERTRTVVPVVEGLVNTGNVSAVMRTAEALGYQTFHLIATGGRYKHSPRTSKGAEGWLDVFTWDTPEAYIEHARAEGYRIAATHLDDTAVPIGDLDFTIPTALVLGNERDGISPYMAEQADVRCIIPSPGFTESFNISVAAAIALYHARQDRIARQGAHADLPAEEQELLMARFCMRSVRRAEDILVRAIREGLIDAG